MADTPELAQPAPPRRRKNKEDFNVQNAVIGSVIGFAVWFILGDLTKKKARLVPPPPPTVMVIEPQCAVMEDVVETPDPRPIPDPDTDFWQ